MLVGGLLFAILLCLKHIYLYLAPAYFVYLLRARCLSQKSIFRIRFGNSVKLGLGILAVFGAAFGPFWYWGQIDQVLSRLFPFSRGLCHAYWAPNVWAMYSFTDRVLLCGQSQTTPHSFRSADDRSRSENRTGCRSKCSKQRHSRTCRRLLLRSTSQRVPQDDLCYNFTLPNGGCAYPAS